MSLGSLSRSEGKVRVIAKQFIRVSRCNQLRGSEVVRVVVNVGTTFQILGVGAARVDIQDMLSGRCWAGFEDHPLDRRLELAGMAISTSWSS